MARSQQWASKCLIELSCVAYDAAQLIKIKATTCVVAFLCRLALCSVLYVTYFWVTYCYITMLTAYLEA